MITADIVDLSTLNEAPDLGLLQVVQVVVVGGAQVGAETPVVAGDDDAAAAGGLGRLDAVLDAEAGLLDGVLEDGGVLVVADAAEVDDAVVREDVLGAAGGVLGGAAGDELGLEVVQQVLVDALVLVLGQDGVVGLEAVLGEELIVAVGLDVCWRVGKLRQWEGSFSTRGHCPSELAAAAVGRDGQEESLGLARNSPGMLTEERVLQAQETVLLGSGHSVQLTCCGGGCVEVSRSLCRSEGWDSGVALEEVLPEGTAEVG